MPKPNSPRVLPPIRVRQEPPTVEEAIVAAQSLTADLEQQVAIAAGLMGLSAEAIRPSVLMAPPLISAPQPDHAALTPERVPARERLARWSSSDDRGCRSLRRERREMARTLKRD